MKFIRLSLLVIFFIPQVLFAQGYIMDPYNHGPNGSTINPMGTPGNLGTIGNLGTPTGNIIPDQGIVPDINPKPLTTKSLSTHLLIEEGGVGDQCKAGITQPATWDINFSNPPTTKDELVSVVRTATQSDTRLRSVHILDDQIDMYYLQPAHIWGFIPTNYYLQVSANGNSLRIALDKPKWLGRAKNQHAAATAAFSMYVPQYLNAEQVSRMEGEDLIARDAEMVKIVSAIMYQVNVSPISNSFFVCYIMPFLLYIIVVIVLGIIGGWFIIRKLRKGSGFLVKKIHPIVGPDDDDEPEHTGNEHETHFRLPRQ